MSYQIEEIEDAGTVFTEKLKFINMRTADDLLSADGSKKVKKSLSKATGKSESKILTWENHSDLFWLKDVGLQFSELLEAAGVAAVKKLATRNHENLHEKLEETNKN